MHGLPPGVVKTSYQHLYATGEVRARRNPRPATVTRTLVPQKSRRGQASRWNNQEGRADSRPSTTNRLVEDMPDQHREWLVDFGDSGYVVPYRIGGNAITITGCAPPERSRVFL